MIKGPVDYSLNDLPPDEVICNNWEDPNVQCYVIENGVRCNRGSKSKRRRLCTTHYARWMRSGSTEKKVRKGVSTKEIRFRKLTAEKNRLIAEDRSTTCFCAHSIDSHRQRAGCIEDRCRCKTFESTNAVLFEESMKQYRQLGFIRFANDTAYCKYCQDWPSVGVWHNHVTIQRMRAHALRYHLQSRKRLAG